MATREFNGTTDFLQCGGTGVALADIANAYSIVALIKPLTLGTNGALVSCARTTTVSPLAELDEGPSAGNLAHYNYLDGAVGASVGATATNWQILGVTKAAGDNQFPRFHQAILGNAAPGTHGTATVSVGSQPTDAWTITQFGRRGTGTNYKNYRIAVAAVFNYQLTDADYDSILTAHSTASIAALNPVALWEFNQAAVTTAVVDLVGNAIQTARTGTTVVADDPVWTYGLATANFPTNTTILDTFTGTEDPVTTNWTGVLFNGDSGGMAKTGGILTNQTGGGTDTSAWWDAGTFGPGVEVFTTVTTASGVAANQFKLLARISNPGTANASGYELHVEKSAGTDIWRIRRRDNVTSTQLGADMNQEIVSGDSIGLACIGNQISAYYKPAAGSWTLVGTRTDSTYGGSGVIGVKTFQASPGAWQQDNFGGGTSPPPPPPGTVPTVPLSLAATAGDSQVILTWSAPTSDGGSPITAYRIYRSLSASTEVLYASPAGTSTTYTDNTAVNGTAYFYEVSAVNSIGESALSNEASVTPISSTPTAMVRKRLYGPTLLGNAAATLYTCPAATTAVIRRIHVSNPTGSPVDFTLSIGTSAAGTRLWDAQPVPADDLLDDYQDFTLAAGEIIQGLAGSAAALNLTIDGYEVGAGTPPAAPIYPSDTLFPSDTSP
jgi:hypothetical protein